MIELATVSLRPEVDGDVDFLRELSLSTRDDEVGYRDLAPAERTAWLEQQFQWQQSQYRAAWPQAWFTIVTVAGRSAGRFCVARQPERLHVVDLALLPEYRGHGIGTKLMKSIQAEALRTGVPVSLYVAAGGTARGFYERLGFRGVEVREMHVRMEWRGGSAPTTAST